MTLTQSEAEKLARTLRGLLQIERTTLDGVRDGIMMLCDHILSGSMKREIENAAYEQVARELYECKWMNGPEAAKIVRALIQPPAQKVREAGR